jgi:hypothetical protein
MSFAREPGTMENTSIMNAESIKNTEINCKDLVNSMVEKMAMNDKVFKAASRSVVDKVKS